jgi:hypothetical protein
MMLSVVTSEWCRLDGWTHTGRLYVLTSFEGGILGQCVACVSSSVSLLHPRVHFRCKTLLYQIMNQNCNILYSDHLIYDLYAYTCIFLLHQESFDMILVNNPSFYDGGVTIFSRQLSPLDIAFIRTCLCVPDEASTCVGSVSRTWARLPGIH